MQHHNVPVETSAVPCKVPWPQATRRSFANKTLRLNLTYFKSIKNKYVKNNRINSPIDLSAFRNAPPPTPPDQISRQSRAERARINFVTSAAATSGSFTLIFASCSTLVGPHHAARRCASACRAAPTPQRSTLRCATRHGAASRPVTASGLAPALRQMNKARLVLVRP